MLLAYALTVAFVFWENATFFFSNPARATSPKPVAVPGSGTDCGGTALICAKTSKGAVCLWLGNLTTLPAKVLVLPVIS
jgi:hypothetical protein